MTEHEIVADGFVVARSTSDPELMRIRFYNDGEAVNVIIPVMTGQLLADEVERATVSERPQPIGPDEMRLGTVFRLAGRQVRDLATGGKRLLLAIEVEDGVRTLPIDLSESAIAELIDDLSKR